MDERSREDYLRQKAAAQKRQQVFDAAPKELRDLWNATGTPGFAMHLWRQGVRGFEDAEREVAK